MDRIKSIVEYLNQKTPRAKLGILVGIIVVLSALFWYFFWSPKAEELDRASVALQREEKKLNEYEQVAKELPKFEKEFDRLNKEFQESARKLPEEKEIPNLIDSIYAAVSGSGLESNTFAPKGEVKKDIYAEIPIEMRVYGNYFELANFFDRIARLPRIVNVRDLNLSREDKRDGRDGTKLSANFTTVTFRLLPPSAVQQETDAKSRKGRRTTNPKKDE